MNRTILLICVLGVALALTSGCGEEERSLPYLGNIETIDGDTMYHRIPEFRFIDQDSQRITHETFADKIYVADFFFTSCPSICPKVKKQMLRIYDRFRDEPDMRMLSHSIDVKRDTVGRLKVYSENLGVDGGYWHFVTGEKDAIFSIADDYFVSAFEDPSAPGGFDHSGRIILIDKDRHVRSYCNGLDAEDVTRFMNDIAFLLESYK